MTDETKLKTLIKEVIQEELNEAMDPENAIKLLKSVARNMEYSLKTKDYRIEKHVGDELHKLLRQADVDLGMASKPVSIFDQPGGLFDKPKKV